MSEKNANWNKQKTESTVNKQGYTEDKADQRPKSQLEQRAKKKNTKI
ncbi:MAG TPA: small, acid-soluble spore protein L [Virgibacillus sp.]|nr:small, acid-soluble spore protein L [Virgibacillus sp.]